MGIPAELFPWVDWVKAKHPEWKCAVSNKDYKCLWPGSLSYLVSDKDGKFTVKAELLAEDKLEIPASAGLFPANIEIKDQTNQMLFPPIEVNEGQVFVKLKAGVYSITGEFFWDEIPSDLPLPAGYGLIDLKFEGLNGEKLEFSRLDNSIRFQDKEKTEKSSSLSLKVFRKILDASPLMVETLLRVQVSGGARSYQIGEFMPKGSHLINVNSPLPYQIGTDGKLSLQLLPGQHDLYFTSVMPQPVSSISLPLFNPEVWPKEETWSWNANTVLRSVEVTNARPVEASLTEMPDEWKNAETYIVGSDATVNFNELRRGKEIEPYSKLNLRRALWIDLDGKGYTVSDSFNGELQQVSRINVQKETSLGRATLNEAQQLITIDPKTNLAGVEIRDTHVYLNAVSRIAKTKTISAIGWDTNVDSLNITLNLPPSWMLFGTLNTSYAEDSWLESWSLFEVFIMILIIIASYKIFGLPIAILVGAAGILNYREFLAPNLLIIHIIILEVCRRLVKDKGSFFYKLFNGLLISTFALWALASLTFTKLQFTQLLFPQLQSGTRYRTALQELLLALENSLFSWPLLLVFLGVTAYGVHKFFSVKGVWKKIITLFIYGFLLFILVPAFIASFTMFESPASRSGMYPVAKKSASYLNEMRRYDGQAFDQLGTLAASAPVEQQSTSKIFQSGPATPEWKWRSHNISVNGPVSANHEITLLLLSPKITRIISALRSLTALLLILYLFRALSFRVNFKDIRPAVSLILLPIIYFTPQHASAEVPPAEIIKEVEDRVGGKICSSETCALIRELKVDLSGGGLNMYFDVSSEGLSSVAVPGPIGAYNVKRVILNGKETVAVKTSEENFLEVKTQDGNNRIEVQGELPDNTSFALKFSDYPLHVKVSAPGWYVEGLSESGEVSRGLHFTREETASSKKVSSTEVKKSFNSWVIAKRSFLIGESVNINTNLERLGDVSTALRVELPVLEGEIVTNKDAAKEAGKLIVFIPAGEKNYVITSRIDLPELLEIKYQKADLLSEEWTVFCESFLACEFAGLKPTATDYQSKLKYLWHPFPGEEVKVNIKTLALAAGEYLTVDKVFHTITWGSNRRSANLQISLRATKQLSFDIKLSENDKIENVTVDGVQGTGKVSEGKASVLLSPGSHEINLNYAKEWTPGIREAAPVFTANADLHNVNVNINPSTERWVVWTGGGFWGPSVVFWAKIIVLVFLLHILVRLGLLEFSFVSTIFLGLGLSTLPIILLCIPLLWLVSLKFIPHYNESFLKSWRISKAVVFWGLSLLTLVIFYHLVRSGLVLQPPMLIVGNNSNYTALRWFFDHAGNDSPSPWVISFPIWYWRAIALAWSGWFVFMLFEWLKQMVEVGREIIKS